VKNKISTFDHADIYGITPQNLRLVKSIFFKSKIAREKYN
jgi:predicted oxidoreductase